MASKLAYQLPNLLMSTSYALNKSYSKKAIVGLENHGGLFRPVVKLAGGGSPHKYVTLAMHDWELLVDQLATMDEYLRHSYVSSYSEFGVPQKIFLPQHDINFTTSYGARAIAIDERPTVPPPSTTNLSELQEQPQQQQQQQQQATQTENAPTSVDGPNPAKKRKYADSPPGIVLHYTTFEGLRDLRECISERLRRLEEDASFVNRAYDMVLSFLKAKVSGDGALNWRGLFIDYLAFKNYYSAARKDIESHVLNNSQIIFANPGLLDLILLEMYGFCLPMIARDLHAIMYE